MGKYKYGKQKEEIDAEYFSEILDTGFFVKPMHRAFLVLLYYIGCRKSEALQLVKEDVKVNADYIYLTVEPLKHGIERPAFVLSRELPYVELLVERWMKVKPGCRVFPFSTVTAWQIVKRVLPHHYPHFFRLNRCVKFLNKEGVTQDEIRQWFAWKSLKTIDSYLGYSQRTIGKLSEKLE